MTPPIHSRLGLLLASFVILHSSFVIPAAAQRALQKNPATGNLLEGFKSGANTIEITAAGTLKLNSGFTLTGGSYLKSALGYTLTDFVPSITGNANKVLAVNGAATGFEWVAAGSGGGITIDTSAITGGSVGNVLYHKTGDVVGEIATSEGGNGVSDGGKLVKFDSATGELIATGSLSAINASDPSKLSYLSTTEVAWFNGTHLARLQAPASWSSSLTYVLPSVGGTLIGTGNLSAITSVGTIASGTWQGSVIAPAYLGTGSSISTKYLRGDGTWQTLTTGDASGPASSTDNAIARFDGTGGKTLQNSTATIDDSGNLKVSGTAGFSTPMLRIGDDTTGIASIGSNRIDLVTEGVQMVTMSKYGWVSLPGGLGIAATRINFDVNNQSNGLQISAGTVSPEGNVTGNPGDLYLRNNSGTGETWRKASGTGNTGWVKDH